MNNDQALRTQLSHLLTLRQAHLDFEDAVANFPEEHINTIPEGCTYSFWHLLEHLRLCQRDILDYIVSDDYVWPSFPDDFWPDTNDKAGVGVWQNTITAFLEDRQALLAIVNDSETDLFAPLRNSAEHKHSILREVNIIASHNAYHTGALVIMRQSLNIWP